MQRLPTSPWTGSGGRCCMHRTLLHGNLPGSWFLSHQHISTPTIHSSVAAPRPAAAAATAAAGSSRQQPEAGRDRRTRQASRNQTSPSAAVAGRQRTGRPRPSTQLQSPARRISRDDEANVIDPLDQEFMDPEQAAKLRRLMKSKGKDAVVDKRGFVKVPLDEAAEPSTSTTSSRSRWSPARTQEQQQQLEQPPAGLLDSSSSSGSPAAGRQKLFNPSQLQPAAPGSGGTLAALPIVRPSGSSTTATAGSSSSSSPIRPSRPLSSPPTPSSSPAAAGDFFSSSSWQQLGATQPVVDALSALGITRPSHVQSEAYKALNPKSGLRHVALADQAGSGKTLAYLLPLLQQLKQREEQLGGPATRPHSPSFIVMTPTAELAQQVHRVVRALSQSGLRVRSAVMTGGQQEADRRSKTFRTQCELLEGGVDVLIATPGRLLAHHERGSLKLDNTVALVLDEVDVLAGGEVSYSEHIAPLRAGAPASMRCVLVSATLPQHTFDELQELFMGLGAAFGPGLHRTATGVVEELIDCSGGDEVSLETGTERKLEALFTALQRVRSPRTVIFCNKIETCRVVENALKRRTEGYQVLAYHEAIRDDLRSAALNTWLTAPAASEPPSILVCTDRTSRGIDSMWCGHVVLFEFPRDPSEYVRRVGRTARGAGGRGVVSALVLGKQVPLAKDILERNRDGVPVHRVPRLWSDK